MTSKTLYKFIDENGWVCFSLQEPDVEYETWLRLYADRGKLLTQNEVDLYSMIDTETIDGWYEVNDPNYAE